jgi:hypothetical protein
MCGVDNIGSASEGEDLIHLADGRSGQQPHHLGIERGPAAGDAPGRLEKLVRADDVILQQVADLAR